MCFVASPKRIDWGITSHSFITLTETAAHRARAPRRHLAAPRPPLPAPPTTHALSSHSAAALLLLDGYVTYLSPLYFSMSGVRYGCTTWLGLG